MRLRSDVPTGSSLSGGLDSSTLSWYIHSIKGSRIKEHPFFSAVFPGFEKDESNYIQAVTKHFNATSYQVMPDASDLIGSFEKLMYHQEEPFPSSSIFAQYKVYELAKQHGVKVLLDGQGADEVFGGYHKYLHWYLQEILSRHRFGKFRKERSAFQRNNIKVSWNYKNTIAAFLPSHVAIVLEKAEYRRIINHPYITKDFLSCTSGGAWEGVHKPIITKLNDILYFNTMQLGLEELLRFADRNSMSQGIEVRLPFLQTDMVEFLFSLPTDMKINYGFTKYILRKLMDKKLPDNIVWRTDKVGFEPPQKKWMQDPLLQDYMYHAKEQLVQLNILKPAVLQKNISPKDAHTANNFDWRYLCIARLLQTKL
jgi:asparagine synthase (glutamine-hydrolysing)